MPHAKAEVRAGRELSSSALGKPNTRAPQYGDPAVKARTEIKGLGDGKRQCRLYLHFHPSFTIGELLCGGRQASHQTVSDGIVPPRVNVGQAL